jgi:HSP20 family protein
MSIIKRETRMVWPPTELNWPEERIDRAFREMFREWFGARAIGDRFVESVANPMRVEEFVDGGECVIRAELPGIDPDKDVEITVTDEILEVKAHREERKEEERPDSYRSEFRYGSLHRVIRLPKGVKESDIKATYKDGILEIRVPVADEVAPVTKVTIERS